MALQAKFDDGVPSVQDQPDSTEPALDGRLAARYERMSEAGRGDGTGVTIRKAVESRSEPLSGIMSTVCTVPTETKRWGGGSFPDCRNMISLIQLTQPSPTMCTPSHPSHVPASC
jgi:hypothetical protein